jgi:hypothetical protein
MFTRAPRPCRRVLNRTVAVSVLVLAFATTAVSPAVADPGVDRSAAPATGVVHRKGAAGVDSTQVYPGAPSAGVAAAVAACPYYYEITRYGYTGHMVCNYGIGTINWGGGNIETFVVGTDYRIWHIWLNSGGWHSLGGLASAFEPNGAYRWFSATQVGVWTYGTNRDANGNRVAWCNAWPWTGWTPCSTISPPPVLD